MASRRAFGRLGLVGATVASGFVAALITAGTAHADTTVTATFGYTGGEQSWAVPAGVTNIHVTAIGAAGGSGGASGNGGLDGIRVDANVTIPNGVSTLYVEVGGAGGDPGTLGGFNGGGSGGLGPGADGGPGGGASDVRTCSMGSSCDTLNSRLVTAAGGGGGGARCIAIGCVPAGDGGNADENGGGSPGVGVGGLPGGSGTFNSGGGGGAVLIPSGGAGGGGGGGWYGGGGGGAGNGIGTPVAATEGGDGGNGSSHVVSGGTNISSGDSGDPASVTISYVVRSTSIAYTGPTSGNRTDGVTLTARLTAGTDPVAGGTVNFSLDSGEACSGVTDGTGNTSCQVTLTGAAGSHQLTISYAGRANVYLPSSTTTTFQIVKKATKIVNLAPASGVYHHPVTVSAELITLPDNLPVLGATLTFALNGSETCTGITDASGVATCSMTPGEVPASYALTAAYAGDDNHLPSNASRSFTVLKEATAIANTGPANIANDEPAHLSAKLTEDIGAPITGRAVSLSIGTGLTKQTCTATTDATGSASCTIASVHQPLNAGATVPLAYSFAGDAFYKPSSGTGTLHLQYMTGRTYGISGKVNLLGVVTVTIPARPDTGQLRTAVPAHLGPACTVRVVTPLPASVLCAATAATTNPGAVTSAASVASVSLGLHNLPLIAINGIVASSHTSCAGVTGSVTIASITVGGVVIHISATVGPNTTIALPGIPGGRLVLNEQLDVPGSDHGLTVNAVHLIVPGSGVSADLVIASATSAIHNCVS